MRSVTGAKPVQVQKAFERACASRFEKCSLNMDILLTFKKPLSISSLIKPT